MNSKKISDEDKEKLINATVKYSVAKGTISELAGKYSKFSMKNILAKIKPVFQMKNVRVEDAQ